MSLTVTHEPDADRYAAYDGDELQGWIIYDHAGGTLRLLHAEVPPLKRGQGVGGAVVQAILQELRETTSEPVKPICGFVASWMRQHPEYADLSSRR
ncbi:GNAT family N-acetyltransferase [Microcella pacifica]|uniref:N-acetyltransferase n=1 Tax=Microcella pacifica TaxID=2591847 RepID=A0A9E5JR06_9MICO|nr:GNAT family N-acetyltransferase [Microcella pacifica]NHF63531.1 N-acetyltransferase [Microcella pacifica]